MTKQAARANEEGESIQGYFRPILEANPKLLDKKNRKNNTELYDLWLRDHPGETEVPDRVKNSLNNLKSQMRKQRRGKKGRKAAPAEVALVVMAAAPPRAPRRAMNSLETLEDKIDACLSMARGLELEGFEEVVSLLRRARNQVIAQAAPGAHA